MADLGLLGVSLFLCIVIAVSVLVALGSIWLANRLADEPAGTKTGSSLSPFLTTVALVYGALLGFTVVVAWEQFSSAAANVTNESATLATMYRQTVAMPEPEQMQVRALLRSYTTAVQGEWGSEDRAGASDTARRTRTSLKGGWSVRM